VVIALSVVNRCERNIRIANVAIDLYSTWIGEAKGSYANVPHEPYHRVAPKSFDVSPIERLISAVDVVPYRTYDSVPTLQPLECYGFAFAIQVKPHLRHFAEESRVANHLASVLEPPSRLDRLSPKDRAESFDFCDVGAEASRGNPAGNERGIRTVHIQSGKDGTCALCPVEELTSLLKQSAFITTLRVEYDMDVVEEFAATPVDRARRTMPSGCDAANGVALRVAECDVNWSFCAS
jgi:hypothetical protein